MCMLFETGTHIWRAQFQKGLNPLLVEIELLVEYNRVSKTAHFDTNFTFLAYSVPKLRPFVNKNNANQILFFFMGNHWWECFLQNKTKRIYIWYDFCSEISKLVKYVIFFKIGQNWCF